MAPSIHPSSRVGLRSPRPSLLESGSLALAATGGIYIGGSFTNYDGFARPGFARVHGDPRIAGFLLGQDGLRMSMYTDPARTYYLETGPLNIVNWTVVQTAVG